LRLLNNWIFLQFFIYTFYCVFLKFFHLLILIINNN
jgi:hypothetical protein